jgi:hypothetical protein
LLPIVASLSRFISVCAVGFWLGGFTFHALVVIPAGHDMLGSRTIGFITQRVTETLNIAGVATVVLLLFNFVLEWRARSMSQRLALSLTWTLLAVTLFQQFGLHSEISSTLESTSRSIRDQAEFRRLHAAYERVAMGQWFSGLMHLWFVVGVPLARGPSKHQPERAE